MNNAGYEYQWASSTDGGETWSDWGNAGETVSSADTAEGQQWKARARATDGDCYSSWIESNAVTIANTCPTVPRECIISPGEPATKDELTASADGSTDADSGDTITYDYQWARSTDGAETWSDWRWTGANIGAAVTSYGEFWKVRARATDGNVFSSWHESDAVRIVNAVSHHFEPGLRLLAVPIEPAAPSPQAIFGDRTVYGEGDSTTYSEPAAIECGHGYWANFEGITDVRVTGQFPPASYGVPFGSGGWHLCGNPFEQTLGWTNVSLPSGPAFGWLHNIETGGYELITDAEGLNSHTGVPPWSGFWVHLQEAGTVTMNSSATPAGHVEPLSFEPASDSDWMLRLVAEIGECIDADNYVGVRNGGAVAVANPPLPGGAYVDLCVAGPEGKRRALSLRAQAAPTMHWDLTVTTNVANSPMVVRYPDLSQIPREYDLYVEDRNSGDRQSMRTTTGYRFMTNESGATRHLRIVATREAETTTVVSGMSARQTGQGVSVTYTLSRSATVDVTILNIAGRPVRRLASASSAAAGINTCTWNLMSDTGSKVPAGTYLCTVSARDEHGRAMEVVRSVRVHP